MSAGLILCGLYTGLIVFYVLYIAAVQIYHAWDSLSPWVQLLAFAPVVIMILVDVLMQATLFTLAFWDLPREAMVTKRLSRYRAGPEGWRKRVATAICNQALNPFDPTREHC